MGFRVKAKQIISDRRGSVMLGLVLVMLLMGSLTILFVMNVSSREVLTPGFLNSSQAYYSAHSGVEYFLQNASDHAEMINADSETEIEVSDATVTLSYTKDSDVLLSTAVIIGDPSSQSSIKISNCSNYVP